MKKSLFSLLAFLLVVSCGATSLIQKDDRESFQKSTERYYKLLQWKYYEKAVQYVDPESARDYESFVLRNQNDLNITSHQIKDVFFTDSSDLDDPQTDTTPQTNKNPPSNKNNSGGKSDRATVRVYYTYYKYPSIAEESVMVEDTWIRIGKLWYISSDFSEGTF